MLKMTVVFLAAIGVAASAKLSRIINGNEAYNGEFPHQISLLHNGYHICGGSVIANNWVLTASHCVDGMNMGSLAVAVNLHDFTNPTGFSFLTIDKIIMHQQYNEGKGGIPNDIALLRVIVPTDLDLSRNIIEVASGNDQFTNNNCVISGWGVTETGSGTSKLLKADVRVLSTSECRSIWGRRSILTQHICVKGESTEAGSGSCNGDSGGPLVCNGLLAGVTSWGINGCHTNGVVLYPSVYARTSAFSDWINNNCENCLA